MTRQGIRSKVQLLMNTKGLSGQLEGLSAPVPPSLKVLSSIFQLGNEPSHTVPSSVT